MLARQDVMLPGIGVEFVFCFDVLSLEERTKES